MTWPEEMTSMKSLLLFAAALLASFAAASPACTEGLPGKPAPLEIKLNSNINGTPQRDVEADLLIKQHCTKCHSESRIMNALQSMQNRQNENYDKEVKSIISRKIRLTNGDISRQDGKKIIEYLVAVRQQKKSGGKTAS